jgi:hypothetical protein
MSQPNDNPSNHELALEFGEFGAMNQPTGISDTPFDEEIPLNDYAPLVPQNSTSPTQQPTTTSSPTTQTATTTAATTTSAFWTIEFYQPYFNVDTVQVLNRIWRTFIPIKTDFLEQIRTNPPDLWGPFWICTSLIVIIVITSNLAGLFNFNAAYAEFVREFTGPNGTYIENPFHIPSKTSIEWTSDFSVVSVGSCVFYTYIGIAPLILWAMMRYKGIQVTIVETLCIYGYSMATILPFAILCIININWLRWIAIMISFAWSGIFVVANLFGEWRKALTDPKDSIFVLIFVAYVLGLHLLLALFTKFYFYTFSIRF